MSIPKFQKDLNGEVVFTPLDHFNAEFGANSTLKCPRAVAMCFEKYIMEHFKEQDGSKCVSFWSGELIWFEDSEVAIIGNFGIGGPAACHVLEVLIAKGLKEVIVVGHAGSLQETHDSGTTFLIEKAIRDEGISQHYLEADFFVEASSRLSKRLGKFLNAAEVFHKKGISWTIDSMYRETKEEVNHYAALGVDTVEMELASIFSVAKFRQIQAAALLVISDYVGKSTWHSRFHFDDLRSHTVWNATLALEALLN